MIKPRRDLFLAANGAPVSAPAYDGNALGAGDKLAGPAVIEEDTTTLLIQTGWAVELHDSGVYLMKAIS